MPPDTYLTRILAAHRARAAADTRSVSELARRAQGVPPTRSFALALGGSVGDGLAVVAEIKRRSPSKGDLDAALDPAGVAVDYEAGGAAAVSVLTDEAFFGGSAADLDAARAACALPVLRKDFVVSEADVYDTRLMGADAVLLIAAALAEDELARLHTLALELSLDALVEVHDDAELDTAIGIGAELVGVNQRDLTTFAVDAGRAARLVGRMPPEVVAVAESGIADAEDARRLADAGYQAVLVGETFVRAPDRRAAVRAMAGLPIGARRPAPGTRSRR